MFHSRTTPSDAGRFDLAYRIGGTVLLLGLLAASPWLHLGVPCEQLLDTLIGLVIDAGPGLVAAAVVLLAVLSGVVVGVWMFLVRRTRRRPAPRRGSTAVDDGASMGGPPVMTPWPTGMVHPVWS